MAFDALARDISTFDAILSKINFSIPDNSSVGTQLALTREFLDDQARLDENDRVAKWQPRFKDFYDAQLVVGRLVGAVCALTDHPAGRMRKYLKTICSGPLTQGTPASSADDSHQPKDFLYELWLAGVLNQAGFTIELREPDIVVSSGGLLRPLGVACKYPSSEKQVHEHLSKGYSQIEKHTGIGVVAIGLDLIVMKAVFPNGVNYIDFRNNDKPPLAVLQKQVDDTTVGLVEARRKLYPSEAPVDGAMLTLTMGGLYGEPVGLAFVTAVALQASNVNPAFADICTLRDGILKLNTS